MTRWSARLSQVGAPSISAAQFSVRFASKATQVLRCRELTRCAKSCREQMQQTDALLDHLVDEREQFGGNF
jgi:hypothetical protein